MEMDLTGAVVAGVVVVGGEGVVFGSSGCGSGSDIWGGRGSGHEVMVAGGVGCGWPG